MAEELNAKTVRNWGERFSNWGRWGDDDQLGTLNFITRERVIAACAIPKAGRVISCALPIHPPPTGSRPGDEGLSIPLPCATQWDALARVSYAGIDKPPLRFRDRDRFVTLHDADCPEHANLFHGRVISVAGQFLA